MSSHGHDDHEGGGHDAPSHAHAHHDDFDPEPTQTVPADEPRTPGWLPVTGISLFVVGTVAVLALKAPSPPAPAAAPSASASARAPTAAMPGQPPHGAMPQPRPALPGRPGAAMPQGPGPGGAMPIPPPGGSGSLRRLSPEDAKAVQDKMQKMREARPAPTAQP